MIYGSFYLVLFPSTYKQGHLDPPLLSQDRSLTPRYIHPMYLEYVSCSNTGRTSVQTSRCEITLPICRILDKGEVVQSDKSGH